jgi:hypothetical protein
VVVDDLHSLGTGGCPTEADDHQIVTRRVMVFQDAVWDAVELGQLPIGTLRLPDEKRRNCDLARDQLARSSPGYAPRAALLSLQHPPQPPGRIRELHRGRIEVLRIEALAAPAAAVLGWAGALAGDTAWVAGADDASVALRE